MEDGSPHEPCVETEPRRIIKPCRVQIVDVLKQSSFPTIRQRGAEKSHNTDEGDQFSVDEPSTSTAGITKSIDDGWIKNEPEFPSGCESEQPELQTEQLQEPRDHTTEVRSKQLQQSRTSTVKSYKSAWESDDDDDFDFDEMDEHDGEDSDDDWIPYDDGERSGLGEHDYSGNLAEKASVDDTTRIEIEKITSRSDEDYLNQLLDNDVLVKIMAVVYGVKYPSADTLTLLKEQMEERPKLKIKLLKDVHLGNSMFQKGGRKSFPRKKGHSRYIVKKQIVGPDDETNVEMIEVKKITDLDSKDVQGAKWTPHKPLTLANATAHVARHHIPPAESAYLQTLRPILPKGAQILSAQTISKMGKDSLQENNNSHDFCTDPRDDSVGNDSKNQSVSKNITFGDQSQQEDRATFLPQSKTIKVPKLDAAPQGSIDVLVPVDSYGQMKPPFMAIPMNTCKLVFSADQKESNEKESATEKCDSVLKSSSSQISDPQPKNNSDPEVPNVPQGEEGPVIPCVPNPASSKAYPISAIKPEVQQPTQQPIQQPMSQMGLPLPIYPQFQVPTNGPYALVRTGLLPPGVPGVFPPGMIPANLLPPVGPIGMIPNGVPGAVPQQRPPSVCTCPPATQPGKPVLPQATQCPPGNETNIAAQHGNGTYESNTPDIGGRAKSPRINADDLQTSSENISSGIQITNVCSSAPVQPTPDDPAKKSVSNVGTASKEVHVGKVQNGKTESVNEGAKPKPTPTQTRAQSSGSHPGSLVTVILPESARRHYQSSKDLTEDLKEVQKPVSKMDLGLLWNEITMMRTEMQFMKTSVATEMHELRVEMGDFMNEVREKLSGKQSAERKRKSHVHGTEDCEQKKRR